MKTIYLVRHAKAALSIPNLDDRERPLTEKGIKRTALVIDFLKKRQVTVDLLLCSPALRALETAELFARGLAIPEQALRRENGIYAADADGLAEQIFGLEQNINTVMIVGHNPAITAFANEFLHPKIEMLPTSGIVGLVFDTDKWEEIMNCKATQLFVVFPKMFE